MAGAVKEAVSWEIRRERPEDAALWAGVGRPIMLRPAQPLAFVKLAA